MVSKIAIAYLRSNVNMKKIHVSKRFVLVVLCTILLTILCAPIYSNHLISGLWQSIYANQNARIDISNTGNAKNTVEIIKAEAPSGYKANYNKQCRAKNGKCVFVNETIDSKWHNYKIKFKAVRNGDITGSWRGPYVRDADGIDFPVLVDYRFVMVNKKQILNGRKAFGFPQPLRHNFKAKNGEVVELRFEARQHHFAWSDLRKFYSFNTLLFLSVLMLAFLLSYKMVQYISKFKLLEHNSRIDIVFAIVFVILLFIPMSGISTAKQSVQERRMLAAYPRLFTGTLNLNYGKQFEKWFNDRFRGRTNLILLNTEAKYALNNVYQNDKAIFFKKSGWMFRKPFVLQTPKLKLNNPVIKELRKFDDFCSKHNIRLYVLIVPPKESVYSDELRIYTDISAKDKKFREYIAFLQTALSDNRVIYPFKELKNGLKKDFVYFKQAHHWTDFGAYLGYKVLARRVKQDFKEFEILSPEYFNISQANLIRDDFKRTFGRGHTTNLLNLNNRPIEEILNTPYNYYDPKDSEAVTEERKEYIKIFKNRAAKNNYRVFMTGNSQNENLLQFVNASVEHVKFLRLNRNQLNNEEMFKFMKYYKNEMLDFKPDIVIITLSANVMSKLADFSKY